MSQPITASELAGELRISVKTVYRMARDGDIPAERWGKLLWRFDIDQVRAARQFEPVDLWAKPSRKRRI